MPPLSGSRGLPPSRRGAPAGTYAALDLGTNNCRLLVARPTTGGFRVIDAFSRIVRLGEGLSLTGRLSEPAIARTVEALRICRDKMIFARGHARPRHRDRGLPLGRQRAGLRQRGPRAAGHRTRNRRRRDRGASGRGRGRRSRRSRRPVDRDVRHRRRIVGDHLAPRRRSRATPTAPGEGLGILEARRRLAGGTVRRRRRERRDLRGDDGPCRPRRSRPSSPGSPTRPAARASIFSAPRAR